MTDDTSSSHNVGPSCDDCSDIGGAVILVCRDDPAVAGDAVTRQIHPRHKMWHDRELKPGQECTDLDDPGSR